MFILLVEDDPFIAKSIQLALRHLNFSIEHVSSAKDANYYIQNTSVDLCLLDLGLPDQDGLDLLKIWREKNIHLPVLVLTARNKTQDCVEALNLGADDYLTKPFELPELIARIHALGRRHRGYASNIITLGDLTLDKAAQIVFYKNEQVPLARREYALLETFMLHPNQVLKNDVLIDKVYGFQENIESNALNVHVFYLRQKIGTERIQTIRGVGYLFHAKDESES
ncbi:response regulator [Acinetobacter stercoris]|uniref:Transcriptional regulatory protein QseB n=1 Tax=Acinetobacter stercoris TaxID=2126983 RepID=A0A2U3N4S7_9GAMM|nr:MULTISPECIES: response regulator [Acinetobacter]SPL72634.1 Transcriptional regulatory protein QseB [Acinetobacter stercoris]